MAVAWLYDGLPVGVSAEFNYVASFAMPPAPPIEPPVEPVPPTAAEAARAGPASGARGPQHRHPRPDLRARPSGSVDVIARCLTQPRGHCFIEAARGLERRAAVVGNGRLAHMMFALGETQRQELRRACATELTLRVAVYQPAGLRARNTRRTISVFCASLRGRCAGVASSGSPPGCWTPRPPRSCAGRGSRQRTSPADAGQALHRTRTDDPFLTMEVLYQLS